MSERNCAAEVSWPQKTGAWSSASMPITWVPWVTS